MSEVLDRPLRVFISYSRQDSPAAERLRQALLSLGFEPYIDKEDILPGEAWQDRLGHLIATADSVVFLISPNSVKSSVCDWEVNEAERLGKRILPVVIRDPETGAVPQRLKRLNYIHMRSEAEEERGIALLQNTLLTDIDWIRKHTEYGEQALRWARAKGKPGFLLRSPALEDAERWIASRPQNATPPTADTQAFVASSRRVATRRRNALSASLAAGVIVALALAGIALWQRNLAIDERVRAENALAVSQTKESLFLAKAAREELASGNALTSVQLALRALPVKGERPFVAEAYGALIEGFNEQRQVRRYVSVPEGDDVSHFAAFVQNVTFDRDGRRFLATSHDNTVRLWDVATATEVAVMRGHAESADWAMFRPGETEVLTSSFDNTTRLWDAGTGKQIKVLLDAYAREASFSRDGSKLLLVDNVGNIQLIDVATGAAQLVGTGAGSAVADREGNLMLTLPADEKDPVVRLWDVATGSDRARVLMRAPVKVSFVTPGARPLAAFDPQRGELVAALADNSVHFWSTTTGSETGELSGYHEPVALIAYGPDGRWLVTVSESYEIMLWDAKTRARSAVSLGGSTEMVHAVAFSADSKLLLVAAGNDRVRVFETDTGYELLSFPVYELAAAQFAPDGKHILTVANDQLVALWDTGLADRAVHMSGHQGVVNDASFSRDGSKVVSASKDGTARIWDAATGRLQSSLAVARASVDSAAFDADAAHVLTVSGDGKARLWDVARGVELQSFDIGDRWRVSAALSPDGRRVITGSSESVKLWDAATGNVVAELGRRDLITEHEVLFSPDGSAILTTTDTGETCLWNGTTGQSLGKCLPPRQPEGKLALASFSADGKLLLVPSDTSVGVFDSRTGSAISKIEVGDHVRQAIFDPAGTKVLVVTANAAQLWEASGSSRVAALQGHESLIMQARFDPSGRTILTASHDRSVRLWDAADGRQLAILRGRRGRIGWTISYEPRGERVLVLSEDNTVSSLWIGSDPGTVIRRAGEKLPARMTADEERRFYITTGDQSPGSAK